MWVSGVVPQHDIPLLAMHVEVMMHIVITEVYCPVDRTWPEHSWGLSRSTDRALLFSARLPGRALSLAPCPMPHVHAAMTNTTPVSHKCACSGGPSLTRQKRAMSIRSALVHMYPKGLDPMFLIRRSSSLWMGWFLGFSSACGELGRSLATPRMSAEDGYHQTRCGLSSS